MASDLSELIGTEFTAFDTAVDDAGRDEKEGEVAGVASVDLLVTEGVAATVVTEGAVAALEDRTEVSTFETLVDAEVGAFIGIIEVLEASGVWAEAL